MNIKLFEDFCPELEQLWHGLEPDSVHHVFQVYDWMAGVHNTVGHKGARFKPYIYVVSDSENRPRMIFPLSVRRWMGLKILEPLGGGQSDYLGPLIHRDWIEDAENIQAAWNEIKAQLPAHDVRHFTKLPEKWGEHRNPMLRVWKNLFQDKAYSAQLPESFDEFKKNLRSKLRGDNNRQRRRLAEMGELQFKIVENDDERRVVIETMIEQKRQRYRSTGVPDIFSDDSVKAFYLDLPIQFEGGASIHVSTLKLDEEILATHWGACYRDLFYFLMPTFIAGKLSTYSPGRLLLEHLIEWSIDNNLKVYDFTIGGEDYKKDWCNQELVLFEHLKAINPFGLAYVAYIRLRRWARRRPDVWKRVHQFYSWYRYGNRP